MYIFGFLISFIFFQRHLLIHSEDRPYKCKFCPKTFRHLFTRIEHERIHTGEKPHKCAFCDRAFAQNSTHRWHEKICKEKPVQSKAQGEAVSQTQRKIELDCDNEAQMNVEDDRRNQNSFSNRHSLESEDLFCKFCGKSFHFKAKQDFRVSQLVKYNLICRISISLLFSATYQNAYWGTSLQMQIL